MESQQPQTGDPCPAGCPGHVHVYKTRRDGKVLVRYYACWACNAKPTGNVVVIEATAATPRRAPSYHVWYRNADLRLHEQRDGEIMPA